MVVLAQRWNPPAIHTTLKAISAAQSTLLLLAAQPE
jgi:hypothetical protein